MVLEYQSWFWVEAPLCGLSIKLSLYQQSSLFHFTRSRPYVNTTMTCKFVWWKSLEIQYDSCLLMHWVSHTAAATVASSPVSPLAEPAVLGHVTSFRPPPWQGDTRHWSAGWSLDLQGSVQLPQGAVHGPARSSRTFLRATSYIRCLGPDHLATGRNVQINTQPGWGPFVTLPTRQNFS